MELIKKYFTNLSPAQIDQFAALLPLYKKWNGQINVISRKDIDNLYLHHVLHSLAIAKVISFNDDDRILDAGTGGGFPGLPLAILCPQTNFLLVDSVGKKLKVINEISKNIGINNVKTTHERVENIAGQFDFVMSRAVTRLDTMWQWVEPKISNQQRHSLPNGLLYLKGGDISQELPANVKYQRWDLSQFFNEPYFDQKALVLLSR
jgi:16S rRNA (guanine527-N7)-methyltransferase